MTTYQRTSIQSDIFDAEPIPKRTRAFFRARLCGRIYSLVLEEFARREQANEISRATLGRKIERDSAQITRWLGSPGNWTLDTVSDLLLGMGMELSPVASSLAIADQNQVEVQPNTSVVIDLFPITRSSEPDAQLFEPENESMFFRNQA